LYKTSQDNHTNNMPDSKESSTNTEKKPVSTNTSTSTKEETKDGIKVITITTTTVETYADGSKSTKVHTKTITEGPKQLMTSNDGGPAVAVADNAKETCPRVENTTDKNFIQTVLETHNKYRAKHGAPPLKLSPDLCKVSQAWVNTLAKKDKMEHSMSGYGENCFWGSNDVKEGNVPVETWYSEVKDFDFKRGDYVKGTGHFTQVVWKESKELGVAKALSKSGATYVICTYEPAGNFQGIFPANVGKPK